MNSLDVLKKNRAIFSEFGVSGAWVFGSVARGEDTAQDVDLLVDYHSSPGLLDYMNLKFRIEDVLGRPVDLVTKSSCKERFYRAIAKDLIRVA
jgi:predicted nucleotidyltransferase